MAKKLIALLLAVMLIMSLTVPAYAVQTDKAPTSADTRTITVGVINYVINDIGADGYQVHYWGGSATDDADLTATGKTEQKSVGSSYWNNAAQTFSMYTAEIPADATGFKVHNGDRWFGDDGATQNRAYIFNYSGDKALYENVAEPTEAPVTEAPATEAETTSEETITVKFTDALGWGSANVYYWPNGGDWPGEAMDKAEVNEYDQTVYTASIPADVDGVIFNGNGNQTVDIKDGIVDGAQWYTVDEKDGSKYKVNLVTDEPETQAEETSAPETQAAVDGKIYFKPGEWANDNARFGVWVSGWKNYTSSWFALESVGDGIYAADLTNTSTWVSCKFARFAPATEGFDDAWNTSAEVSFENGKLYTVKEGEWDNAGLTVTEYDPDATQPQETAAEETQAEETTAPAEGAYYVVGSFNEWTASDAYKLTAVDGADTEEYTITLDLTKDAQLKVIYTDGENTTWFPEGMGNDYTVTADGKYDIYFRPKYDGKEDWYEKVLYAAAQTIEVPTEEETAAPATEAATEAETTSEETITVKFTDALGWGDVHVYYWDNGAEWPGTAMDKAEVNEFGQQVYTATIPADVKGIIFNGNGNQTVDITEGIADGAQWYTVDEKEGNNYKVNLVTDEPATEAATDAETTAPATEAETTAPAEGAYYVVGTFNEWTAADAYKLTAVDGAETEEYTITLDLTKDAQLKVIYTDGENTTWFPEGMDNNYIVTADGKYDIYFRPKYDGKEDWYEKVLYVAAQTIEVPTEEETTAPATEAETTAPATEAETTAPATTITVKFTDALGWGDVHVYYWDNGAEWPGTAMDKAEVNEFGQQVYTATIPADVKGIIFNGNGNQTVDITEGIADGAQWYTVDEKEGNNYKVNLVTDEPATEAETTAPATEAETTAPAEGAYYVVGTFNEWTAADAYRLTAVDGAETEEYTITLDLTKDAQLKVIYTDGENITWFPEGMDNNYIVTADGKYDIYFRPNYDGYDDWFSGCIYAAAKTVDEPTEAETTAPATEAETTAPATTITVKFTDAMNYGDVNVYYWPNGGDWPGKAMEKAEVNEYEQTVYTAAIPADVDGVIFNGNGRQTVDITEGIADGAWWYTVEDTDDAGHNYVKLVGGEPATEAATEAETTAPATEAETTAPAPSDYFLVGNLNDWSFEDEYALTKNTAAETEEYMISVDLTTTSQFKIVKLEGLTMTWFPTGVDNNYGQNGEITANGTYTVYFRPNYDGGEDWFNGCIYAALESEAPTEVIPTEPATEAATEAETTAPAPSDYFLVGNLNDWSFEDEYALTKNTAAETEEYMISVDLTTASQFKIVKLEGLTMTWFPTGVDNNYGQNGEITANGTYTVYFRPNYDGGEDWFNGCIYAALESEAPTEVIPTEPATQPETTSGEIILGDVDGDGEVTSLDATYIQRQMAFMDVKTFNETAADIDGDGEITSLDVTYIQRYLAFMDVKYPIDQPI